jgi:signal transduction histidine kinase
MKRVKTSETGQPVGDAPSPPPSAGATAETSDAPDAGATVDEASALFGAAAHEIKNALGPLAMTLQLAERQLLAGQSIAHADLAFARGQVRRISRLVGDLMDLTRVDLGQLAVEPAVVDLRGVVSGSVATFRRGHGGAVSLALPEGVLSAPVDGVRIEQVLLNMLENAARYSPAGAPIAVELARREARARVTVRDHGPGVPADEQKRVFDRFVRGSTAKATGGLGIGLYLCRIIVERHGGEIGVDSAPGGGSSFWFDLPCR